MKEILLKHNEHWSGKKRDTGISRVLLPKLIDSLEVKHIVAISGSRRSGKSYLFRQIHEYLSDSGISSDNILKINFEDPYFIHRKDDPKLLEEFYSEYLSLKNPAGMQYIFLDETQSGSIELYSVFLLSPILFVNPSLLSDIISNKHLLLFLLSSFILKN